MFSDDKGQQINRVTLADCRVSRAVPFEGNARFHSVFTSHEQEYCGLRESRSFGGFGISLLRPDNTPLPLYRDKDGALLVACEDGESFAVELHVRGGDKTSDRWAALVHVNGEQRQGVSSDSGGAGESVYHLVTQPQSKGENIVPGWTQSSGAVAPFVAQSVVQTDIEKQGASRYGVVSCTFYSEYHPQRFVSPTLKGPSLRGDVVHAREGGIVDARPADFTVCRDFNVAVEIRFAPQVEIDRLKAERIGSVNTRMPTDTGLSGLSAPSRFR